MERIVIMEEKQTMKERLEQIKIKALEKRYDKIFAEIESFENQLEEKFKAQILNRLFDRQFSEYLKLQIPYTCEAEKRLISSYLSKIEPAGKATMASQGILLDISSAINPHKMYYEVVFKYTIHMPVELDELMEVNGNNETTEKEEKEFFF